MDEQSMPQTLKVEEPQVIQENLPSAGKMLSEAFSFYKKYFSTIAAITILPAALLVINGFVWEKVPGITAFVLSIVAVVISIISSLALIDLNVRGGEGSVGELYTAAAKRFFSAITINIFTTLYIIGCITPIIAAIAFVLMGAHTMPPGSLLLVVPVIGMFVVILMVALSTYIVFSVMTLVAEGKKGLRALAASWHYTRGSVNAILWRMIVLGVVFFVAVFLASMISQVFTGKHASIVDELGRRTNQRSGSEQALPNIVSQMVLAPISTIYLYGIYAVLRAKKGQVVDGSDEDKKTRRNITILVVLGIIGIIGIFVIFGTLLLSFFGAFAPRGTSMMAPFESLGMAAQNFIR